MQRPYGRRYLRPNNMKEKFYGGNLINIQYYPPVLEKQIKLKFADRLLNITLAVLIG